MLGLINPLSIRVPNNLNMNIFPINDARFAMIVSTSMMIYVDDIHIYNLKIVLLWKTQVFGHELSCLLCCHCA